MSDLPIPESKQELIAQVEALLFVAPSTVTAVQLATSLDVSTRLVEKALQDLRARYSKEENQSGIRLQEHLGRYQLISAPEYAVYIERFIGLEASGRFSRAALETLAIIAYQQPVTRPEIDSIRGVNSDGVLKSLMSKGLVQEVGRAERPGRPILYASTSDFLQHFGLTSLQELPPLATDNEVHNDPEASKDA